MVNKEFFTLAFSVYKKNILGLPSFVRLVMLEVYEYCDHSTGTISITSLENLARDNFHVDSLRGRMKEEINGDTIRNAFRSIKKAKPDHFQFSTINQKIVIHMPFMCDLYQSFLNETPELDAILAADVADATTLTQHGESVDLDPILATDVSSVLAAASLDDAFNALADVPAKIKPKTNKTNKQNTKSESFSDLKQPIARDFYPSPKTIELALEKGFVKVTSDIEIKRFVMYNEASLSRWADYNPVFLKWLEKDHNPDIEHAPATPIQRHLRKNHGYAKRSTHQVTGIQSAVFDSNQRNLQIIADEKREREACGVIEGEYCEFVDVAHVAV